MTKHAIIVGAGIAGPATCMALQATGWEVTLLERRLTPDWGVGSFLTLGTNGIRALEALGCSHVATDAGFETPVITLVGGRQKNLGDVTITGPAGAPVSRTMRRSAIYEGLLKESQERGVHTRAGAGLEAATENEHGVTAHLSDRSTLRGDLLVGCDGIWSTVRMLIDPQAPDPTYTGLMGHGGYAPAGAVDQPAGTYRMIFGRRAFFGYAIALDGQAWWFVNEPRRPEPRHAGCEGESVSERRERLAALFDRDQGPAADIIRATSDLAPSGPIHVMPHLPRWHSGRQVVIGDAAHAPSPSSGQGASLAIEDAVVLAEKLHRQPDIAGALASFEQTRRPRVESIIAQAARVNSTKAATGPARIARDLILPLILRAAAGKPQLRDTYDHVVTMP